MVFASLSGLEWLLIALVIVLAVIIALQTAFIWRLSRDFRGLQQMFNSERHDHLATQRWIEDMERDGYLREPG